MAKDDVPSSQKILSSLKVSKLWQWCGRQYGDNGIGPLPPPPPNESHGGEETVHVGKVIPVYV